MEQELTNMLELLRQGLSELPAIGSDVFNIYIRGIRIEGVVKVATYLIVISILIYLIRYFKKKQGNLGTDEWKDRNTYKDLETIIMTLMIITLVIFIIACFGIYNGLMKLLAPDYMLIKEVIAMLAN